MGNSSIGFKKGGKEAQKQTKRKVGRNSQSATNYFTAMPIFLAVPFTMLIAFCTSAVFRSGSFFLAISSTVSEAKTKRSGFVLEYRGEGRKLGAKQITNPPPTQLVYDQLSSTRGSPTSHTANLSRTNGEANFPCRQDDGYTEGRPNRYKERGLLPWMLTQRIKGGGKLSVGSQLPGGK